MADQQDLKTDDRAVADGVVLFQRKRSRVWQARIRHESGKWMVVSTGQTDFEQAKQAAIAKRDEILKLKSKGQVVLTRRFRDVAKLTIKRLEKELTDGVGKEVYRHYIQAIDNYLIPCFGNAHVDSIDGAKLRDLDTFRTTKLGRVANRSTVTTHNAALKRVFKVAVEKGFMPTAQVPDLVNKGKKPQSRPYFDKADYDKLVHSLRPFAGTGHSQVTKDLRTLLWDYVLILGNTGMRTGREALSLKWLNIRRVQVPGEFDAGGKPVLALQFSVTGKTGSRDLIARDVNDNVTKPLQRIQSRFPALAVVAEPLLFQVDELVFRLPDGNAPEHERLVVNFKKLLEKKALRLDAHGNKRTLYSLRHTYATLALLNGMSMETLAVQMGTSITMIERHYSKLKPQMHAHALSGGAVKQRNAAKKLQGADAKTLAELHAKIAQLETENQRLTELSK